MGRVDYIENKIYEVICSHDGIKARDIAHKADTDRKTVNHYLYSSPFMTDLCYIDQEYRWHGLIRQTIPHRGLADYAGYYGTVEEFLILEEDEWIRQLEKGCRNIGRNLNDTRGLYHSFKDARLVIQQLFKDLEPLDVADWELVFELRIRRSRMIRIYADVLVITPDRVFSLEFKMKDTILPEEVLQAVKYTEYLEVIFGSSYDVIPCLVLTNAQDLYTYTPIGNSGGELPVVSGDMLFNLFDEYLGFLE